MTLYCVVCTCVCFKFSLMTYWWVGFLWSGVFFFFFKQKTAYDMRISDWSSDVCSSDLGGEPDQRLAVLRLLLRAVALRRLLADLHAQHLVLHHALERDEPSVILPLAVLGVVPAAGEVERHLGALRTAQRLNVAVRVVPVVLRHRQRPGVTLRLLDAEHEVLAALHHLFAQVLSEGRPALRGLAPGDLLDRRLDALIDARLQALLVVRRLSDDRDDPGRVDLPDRRHAPLIAVALREQRTGQRQVEIGRAHV